ncbi:MAG: choice-of-anchor tandem repeat GloVer-containing protein [Candidatus Korobacteraceae bacterium]
MNTAHELPLERVSLSRILFVLFILSVATAVAAPAQSFASMYSFCTQANCPDGNSPNGWLAQGLDGNFYGTTSVGGANGYGTVFKIASGGLLTTLHSFNDNDGNGPSALILATDGNFYGTTSQGGGTNCPRGSNLCGTVFKITPSGTLTTLYVFCSQSNCTDGFRPTSALVQGRDGNLYGTTFQGGAVNQCAQHVGCGTIFKITLSGTLTTLYTFCPSGNCPDGGADGALPGDALVQGADGSFYGTTTQGGSLSSGCTFGCGTFFKVTASGALIPLFTFTSTDAVNPGQIMQATDGNFYGTTEGTLYQMTPGGALTTIHTFDFMDGYTPVGLLEADDGNFYGTAEQGGGSTNCVFGCGTVFKTNSTGTITTLHAFGSTDGSAPMGGLLQSTDGYFYGTTSKGGNSTNCPGGCGTVFRLGEGLPPFLLTQPSFGSVGAPITILGTNLSAAMSVSFNGTPATFTVVSGSEITTTVPVGATTGTVKAAIPGNTLVTYSDFQVIGPLQFVPVPPCRLVDTRQTHNPIQGGTSRSFLVPQLGGCNIPVSAAAYSLNVTVSPYGRLGYLTIWPDGEIQSYVSTMNSPDGRIKANAAIVPAGNNAVSVYVSDTTDVILDIAGYFASSSAQTYEFYPLTPCRIVDTRDNQDQGMLQAGVERDYTIPPNCAVPSSAVAYSFNVTVLPSPGGLDYLTVWPQGETQPTVSTLNDDTGTVVANAAIVPAGSENATAFYAHSNSTNLLLDIDGYFAPPGTGGLSMYPMAPCRVLDTRQSGGSFSGEKTVNVVGSTCAPPANAAAYIFNATVVPPGSMPFLTLWPDGEQQPVVSTLNAYDGFITSNMAIVPTNNGSIDAYAAALTQLVLDISGYFAP